LIHEIEEYGKINTRINVSKSILAWCVYAGIGTVHHWKVDGDSFDKKCIFETLTEERGVFAMDEYVQDCIGHPHDSTEGKRLTAHIMSTAKYCIDNILYNDSTKSVQFFEVAPAMFTYVTGGLGDATVTTHYNKPNKQGTAGTEKFIALRVAKCCMAFYCPSHVRHA
jgi:hypothetical protein